MHDGARIARGDVLHAGADVRRFGAQQRHRLALHVRSHQRAVGVVVLEERNQAGGHRDQLLGTDVHVLDFVLVLQHEVAGLPGVDQFGNDVALFVQLNVGLRDEVLVFFPRRQIVAMGFELDRLLLGAQLAIGLVDFGARQTRRRPCKRCRPGFRILISSTTVPFSTRRYGLSMNPYSLMRAKHESDEIRSDVRAFRRLDGADAAVVRGMHVADFESGALARQTAWSKSRKTALVRDLRQRIGLIHELRELAGAEELADRGHHGLGVHQVVRHGRRHFLVHRHLFLDGALHAHQADAELVFEQLAHRANAAVAQVIDVVHGADAACAASAGT